jgi:leader peptidase (prepilin peptidase)/N-methyltransferase
MVIDILIVALFGLAFGSFLNVVILRLPKEQSLSFPASHCPQCKHKLKIWHNIPLISWIFLKGKCAFCKCKISKQYPLVELITSLIFVAAYLKEQDLIQAALISLVFSLLLALSMIDFKYKAVPDSLNLLALSLALLYGDVLLSITNALLFAGGFTLLRFYVSFFAKKEAMGEADIMIAGTIGAILGIKLGMVAIFFSAFLAIPAFLIAGQKNMQLPYIPFLALSMYLVYLNENLFILLLEYLYG